MKKAKSVIKVTKSLNKKGKLKGSNKKETKMLSFYTLEQVIITPCPSRRIRLVPGISKQPTQKARCLLFAM